LELELVGFSSSSSSSSSSSYLFLAVARGADADIWRINLSAKKYPLPADLFISHAYLTFAFQVESRQSSQQGQQRAALRHGRPPQIQGVWP
jgi:hypothetical protein